MGRVATFASEDKRYSLGSAVVDARFVAVAREAMPALLDVVEALDRAYPFNQGLPAAVVAALERVGKIVAP